MHAIKIDEIGLIDLVEFIRFLCYDGKAGKFSIYNRIYTDAIAHQMASLPNSMIIVVGFHNEAGKIQNIFTSKMSLHSQENVSQICLI